MDSNRCRKPFHSRYEADATGLDPEAVDTELDTVWLRCIPAEYLFSR